MTIDSDQLKYLLELKYAGVAFPCVSFTENSSQDMAVHKYPNLDSARVELTGRNPSTFSCKAIFTNNIYPGEKETWKQGELFPHTFEILLNQLHDSTNYHVLQHPFLGYRNVVPVKWDYSFIGKGPRDGVFLDISWIETIGDEELATTISSPSTLVSQATATSIDTELTSTPLTPMNPPNLSLGQMFSKISGLVRNIASLPQQVIGPINAQIVQSISSIQGAGSAIMNSPAQLAQYGQSVVNQNKGLVLHGPISNSYYYNKSFYTKEYNINQAALTRVYNTVTAMNSNSGSSATHVVNNIIAFTEAMINYYQTLLRVETAYIVFLLNQFLGQLQKTLISMNNNNRNYAISTYVTKVPSTLFSLSKILNNTTTQLLQLNSSLNKLYIIPDGTSIRYYQG